MRSYLRTLTLLVAMFLCSFDAMAADLKVAVVDLQAALEKINDYQVSKARFDGIRSEKMSNIQKMEQNLTKMQTDLRNQSAILSDSARREKEEAFMAAQAQYQQAVMTAQQELQNTEMQMMNDLLGKLQEVSAKIGAEKNYNLILEASTGVVYTNGLPDITEELVTRYNSLNPKK